MGFLIFGTLWFWLLTIGASILIIYIMEEALSNEYKDGGGGMLSTLTLVACVILYYFFGSKEDVQNVFIFIKDHPILTLLRIVAYMFIGIIWSIFKWYFFLQNKKESLMKRIETEGNGIRDYDIPKARRNKSRIISWMSYWPFSAFWTLINEPVKKMFKQIYSKIEKIYEKMSDKIFADIKKDIKKD